MPGRERWRLRAPGKPTVTIKGKFGSPEFAANYRAAMEGESVATTVTAKHGTFDALGRILSKVGRIFTACPGNTAEAARHSLRPS